MNPRIVSVVLPAPNVMTVAGPAWTFRTAFWDRLRLAGMPGDRDNAPLVALDAREDTDPFGEATLFLDPATARAVAAALLAAAEHAEGGATR